MEEFNCKSVQALLWDGNEHDSVKAHVRGCQECNLRRREIGSLRSGLRNLPQKAISPLLSTRLRVIASRERSRRLLRQNLAARFAEFRSRLKLSFDNLLRPLAVPAAGGILASFFCFSVIVDTLHVHPDWRNDIPVGLFTEVTMSDSSPFSFAGKDVIVQLTVDETGHVSNFTAPEGTSSDEMREIGNLVLYSTYTPAVSFGQRVSSKILVITHHIEVRG
jgi:hypothetical protein